MTVYFRNQNIHYSFSNVNLVVVKYTLRSLVKFRHERRKQVKFYATVVVRTGWNPTELTTYDFGSVSLKILLRKVAEIINENTLLVDMHLWNDNKRNEIVKARGD